MKKTLLNISNRTMLFRIQAWAIRSGTNGKVSNPPQHSLLLVQEI